jgi:signal transduction histidine kinase
MERIRQMGQQFLRSRHLPVLLICLTVAILGLTIFWSDLRLRQRIREQIVNHDGEILHAVSLLQQDSDGGDEPAGSLDDPVEQFNFMMGISRLKGVIGIRLFTPAGKFYNAFPAYISEAELPQKELSALRTLKPVSRFYPEGKLQDVDLLARPNDVSVPLLVVDIPVHLRGEARMVGVAQFIIQGETIAREYRELDRHLFAQASIAFSLGGGILAAALALAFRLLSQRTERLLRADQELALAARTSAVGAVAAHLIHGLKNPLSGLQSFVSSQSENQSENEDSDWHMAMASAQRMQSLIGQAVRVLGEQQSSDNYEVSLHEIVECISKKTLPQARAVGVRFTTNVLARGNLANRDANLVILILENLIQNAVQATPAGGAVSLKLIQEHEQIVLEVRDEGPGFPNVLKSHLFAPCRSTKPGGSGIGLAISKQLANHLGAGLELKDKTGHGCLISLSLPATIFSLPSARSAELVEP